MRLSLPGHFAVRLRAEHDYTATISDHLAPTLLISFGFLQRYFDPDLAKAQQAKDLEVLVGHACRLEEPMICRHEALTSQGSPIGPCYGPLVQAGSVLYMVYAPHMYYGGSLDYRHMQFSVGKRRAESAWSKQHISSLLHPCPWLKLFWRMELRTSQRKGVPPCC